MTRFAAPNTYEWDTNALGMHVVALHRLEPTSTGTHVTLSIDVSGLTAPLLGWIVARVSRKFLPMEAAALKAEWSAASLWLAALHSIHGYPRQCVTGTTDRRSPL